MVGYDTVRLYLPAEDVTPATQSALESYAKRNTFKLRDGEVCGAYCTGVVNGIFFCVSESGISLSGSLANMMHGVNVEALHRNEILQALERLGALLHTDVRQARVTRVDVAATMLMQHKPQAYFTVLGSLKYFQRKLQAKTTLEYHRGKEDRQVLSFYDKAEECRARGKESLMPSPYRLAGNALRYEARLMSQPGKQIGVPCLNAGMLADPEVFSRLKEFWLGSYKSIAKIYAADDLRNVASPKVAKGILLTRLLSEKDAGYVDEFLLQLREAEAFGNDRKAYARLEAQIREAQRKYSNRGDWGGGSLARELETAILNEAAYA